MPDLTPGNSSKAFSICAAFFIYFPCLTKKMLAADQRQSMRDISRREGPRNISVQRKRKHQSPETPSVQAAAKEFLEKAARELLGNSKGGVKGPLVEISSDDD